MSVVLDATDRLRLKRTQGIFARLFGIAEEQRKDLERDPLPHLARACQENERLRQVLEEAYYALCPPVSSHPVPPEPVNVTAETFARARRAEQILATELFR